MASDGNYFIQEMAAFWESRPTPGELPGTWDINGNLTTFCNNWLPKTNIDEMTQVVP